MPAALEPDPLRDPSRLPRGFPGWRKVVRALALATFLALVCMNADPAVGQGSERDKASIASEGGERSANVTAPTEAEASGEPSANEPPAADAVAPVESGVPAGPRAPAQANAGAPQATPEGTPAAAKATAEGAPASAAAGARDRSGWILFPVAGFSPETSLELGGLVIYFFDLGKESSLSSFPVLVIGTLREQLLVEVRPELFFDHDNYRIWSRIDVQRFPDFFFGVGNDVRTGDKEAYERSFLRVRTNLRRRVFGDLHAGIISDHLLMDLQFMRSDGLFATRDYLGEEGGLTAGIGPTVAFDTRDHKNYPKKGVLVELSLTPFSKYLGSEYGFLRTEFDARAYLPTFPRQLLAVRYLFNSTGGAPPFYMLPQLGGGDLLRGYFHGKYRDKYLEAVETEYRAHLFWRVRGVLFAGVGHIGETYPGMWDAPLRPSFGAGLRYNMKDPDDIVNFRLDFGWWPWTGDSGLYVAATEVF